MTNEELAIKIRAGDKTLISTLWEQNLKFFQVKAYSLYNRYPDRCASSGITVDDILQVCFFALLDAIQAFNTDDGWKLLTYVKYPLLKHFRSLLGILSSKRNPLNIAGSLNESTGEDSK